MDIASLANLLLFIGALGVSFAMQDSDSSSDSDEGDSLYNESDYERTDRLGSENDIVTADTDNLAWFMDGGDDRLTGSSGNDYADLGTGDDSASMGAGNDIIEAGAGNDTVSGGNGNDFGLGGEGADNFFGDLGNDSLDGGDGNDTLAGGSGADVLSGGLGDDLISGFSTLGGATGSLAASDGADLLFGGNGNDTLILGRGDAGTGGAGNDTFQMDTRWRDGTETFRITDYTDGEDRLVVHFAQLYSAETSLPVPPTITVRLSADGQSSVIVMNGTAIATVEGVTDLTAADVTLLADTETDTAYQPNNFDSILPGTANADTSTGTGGNDYGRFGDGNDSASGGNGNDSLRGEDGADTLSGDAGNDTLIGGANNDLMSGGEGSDAIACDTGNDVATGGAGADRLFGGAGDDTLSGFDLNGAGGTDAAIDGADWLSGGDGNDSLILGRGDTGTGGAGADTFILAATSNGDATSFTTISDYVRGTDGIKLRYTRVLNTEGVEVPPVVTVTMGPSNAYAVITFNGDPIAHVTGATTLTLADITLVPEG